MIYKLLAQRLKAERPETARAIFHLDTQKAMFSGTTYDAEDRPTPMKEAPADEALVLMFTEGAEKAGLVSVTTVAIEVDYPSRSCELTCFGRLASTGDKAHFTEKLSIA